MLSGAKNTQGAYATVKDRNYSLLIPLFMDGAITLIMTTVPFLAIRFGATEILLGTLGWIPATVRLPICLTSGHLSERFGRKRLIIPAASVLIAGSLALSIAPGIGWILLVYCAMMGATGAFYPPLQALISDVSKRGELTKNLGAFNNGWTMGNAVMATLAVWLIVDLSLVLYVAAAAGLLALILVASWRRSPSTEGPASEDQPATPVYPGYLVIVARMGHFTGFFGFGVVRMLFPKLGKDLGWADPDITKSMAAMVIGLAGAMVLTRVSPWWRGKLWPQVMVHTLFIGCGLTAAITTTPSVFSAAFCGIGAALGIAYTAALYHGLSGRKDRGRNTGIHEALVAAGGIAGCLLGGIVAEHISPRAPYILIACLGVICLIGAMIFPRLRQYGTCEDAKEPQTTSAEAHI